ncbi:MAG: hypothetical protein LIP08_10660 [Bacteroides sp.]|nr:hypothetical protein [Bacteroides sp.]
MNCLFDEQFPVSPLESTALSTYLSYGSHTDVVRIVDKSGNVQEISGSDAALFDYTVSFGFPFARVFDYLQKESENPALQELTFIDTPGLFSYDTDHSVPACKAAAHCDVVFWFIRVDKGLDQTSIDYMKEHLSDTPLYFVMTFTDSRGVHDADGAMQVILETARQHDIGVKGHLKFGRRPETQAAFKKECDVLIRKLTDTYQKYSPLGVLVSVMTFLRDMLVKHQKSLKKAIGEATAEQNKILNTFSSSQNDFVTSHTAFANRFQKMIKTFTNRCANAAFCGGAAAALALDMQQISNSMQSMANAYNNIDYNNLVGYGGIMELIGKLEEENLKIENLKNECNELLNRIGHD